MEAPAFRVQAPRLPGDEIDAEALLTELDGIQILVVADGHAALLARALLTQSSKPLAKKAVEALRTAAGDVGFLLFSGGGEDELLSASIALKKVLGSSTCKPAAVIGLDVQCRLAGAGSHTELSHVSNDVSLSNSLSGSGCPRLRAPALLAGVVAEAMCAAADSGVKTCVALHLDTRASELASPAVAGRLADGVAALASAAAAPGSTSPSLAALARLPALEELSRHRVASSPAWLERVRQACHLVSATSEKSAVASMFA